MMRNLLPVFLLALTLGCAKADLISPEEADAHARARTKGATILTVQTPTPVGGLVVNLLKVEDSRCPKEVTCFWYGNATATFQLKDAHGTTLSQSLYLGEALSTSSTRGFKEADTVVVQLGTKPYRLILSDVQPYPTTNNPSPGQKKAMLSVKAL